MSGASNVRFTYLSKAPRRGRLQAAYTPKLGGQRLRFNLLGEWKVDEMSQEVRGFFKKIESWFRVLSPFATVAIFLIWLTGKIFGLIKPASDFISENLALTWLVLLTIWLIALALSFWRIWRRFATGFSDNFRDNPSLRWDTQGKWQIPEKGTLLVQGWGAESGTRSDAGGITKVGALWENYILSCNFKLLRSCLGVIVRASDLNNYYMFQILKDNIVPHRRWSSPLFSEPASEEQSVSEDQAISARLMQVGIQIGWQVVDPPTPVKLELHTWYRLRIKVEGASVWLYINDGLYLHKDNFLDITMGRIGFRNHGYEEALVRKVKVRAIP